MDDLKILLGELRGEMNARMTTQDKVLEEIRVQVRATNGRVTTLEIESQRNDAAKIATQVAREEAGKRIQWWIGTCIAASGAAAALAGLLVGNVI